MAVEPYYTKGRENTLYIYNSQLLPAYSVSQPYVEKTYSGVREFTTSTILPYTSSAWTSAVILFDRTIWPQVRILYGKNVEPQLVRIGERLGRYRDGQRLKAAVEDSDTTSASTLTSSLSSLSSSLVSDTVSETSEASTAAATEAISSPSSRPTEDDEEVRQKITDDLKNWQEKFAKAADKGSEDLEQRVKDITDRQIVNQVKGVGEALFIQLEETASSEIRKLKNTIVQIIKALPEEPTARDHSKADENLAKATKQAGLHVKNKAQALREWKDKFEVETNSLVSAASESTLEVIDNIRDLGLQEIGMRWAWMEGVTYKDWSKYHSVKKTFDEWRQEVEAVATEHDGLRKASDAAVEIESKGMATAEHTAQELRRLKDVGIWKVQNIDSSDDFSTRTVPAAAAKQGQKVVKQASSISEKILGSSQDIADSVPSQASTAQANAQANIESIVAAAKDKAQQVSSQAGEVFENSYKPAQEPIANKAPKSASSASSAASQDVPNASTSATKGTSSVASVASKKVYGGAVAQAVGEQKPILDDLLDEDATYSETMQSIIEQAGGRYADVTRAVSEALSKATSTQGTVESATSLANEQYSKALAAASSALYGTQQGAVESMTSVAADKYSEAVAA